MATGQGGAAEGTTTAAGAAGEGGEGGEGGGGGGGGGVGGGVGGNSAGGGCEPVEYISAEQQTGLDKVEATANFVKDRLDATAGTGEKFVIFAHHVSVVDRLNEELEKICRKYATKYKSKGNSGCGGDGGDGGDGGGKPCDFIKIVGETPMAEREALRRDFEKVRVPHVYQGI